MKILTDRGIYLYDLTDAEVRQIEQKFGKFIDFFDSDGPDNNILFMEHLSLKDYKEIKQWLKNFNRHK